jgi:hypothetical protein
MTRLRKLEHALPAQCRPRHGRSLAGLREHPLLIL